MQEMGHAGRMGTVLTRLTTPVATGLQWSGDKAQLRLTPTGVTSVVGLEGALAT